MRKHELATVIDMTKKTVRLENDVERLSKVESRLDAARYLLRECRAKGYDVDRTLKKDIDWFLEQEDRDL